MRKEIFLQYQKYFDVPIYFAIQYHEKAMYDSHTHIGKSTKLCLITRTKGRTYSKSIDPILQTARQ